MTLLVWAIAVWGTINCHAGIVICLHSIDDERFYTQEQCRAFIPKTKAYREHPAWRYLCVPVGQLGE